MTKLWSAIFKKANRQKQLYESSNKSVMTDCSVCIFETAWTLWFRQQWFYIWNAVSHIYCHFITDYLLQSPVHLSFPRSLHREAKLPGRTKIQWLKANCPIMFRAFCPLNIDLFSIKIKCSDISHRFPLMHDFKKTLWAMHPLTSIDIFMQRWMDGWMDRKHWWMDRTIDGRMDRWTDRDR